MKTGRIEFDCRPMTSGRVGYWLRVCRYARHSYMDESVSLPLPNNPSTACVARAIADGLAFLGEKPGPFTAAEAHK